MDGNSLTMPGKDGLPNETALDNHYDSDESVDL